MTGNRYPLLLLSFQYGSLKAFKKLLANSHLICHPLDRIAEPQMSGHGFAQRFTDI